MRRLPGLDAVRLIAALVVLGCHVVDDRRFLLAPAAVDVFFVLSGMVVGRSLLSALSRRRETVGQWLVRRWRRTLPPA